MDESAWMSLAQIALGELDDMPLDAATRRRLREQLEEALSMPAERGASRIRAMFTDEEMLAGWLRDRASGEVARRITLPGSGADSSWADLDDVDLGSFVDGTVSGGGGGTGGGGTTWRGGGGTTWRGGGGSGDGGGTTWRGGGGTGDGDGTTWRGGGLEALPPDDESLHVGHAPPSLDEDDDLTLGGHDHAVAEPEPEPERERNGAPHADAETDGQPETAGETQGQPETAAAPEPDEERQWRVDIDDHDPAIPLEVGTEYTVQISVDPSSAGAAAVASFLDAEALFADPSVGTITLTVQVSSSDFEVVGEPVDELVVPRAGRTPEPASFTVRPLRNDACTLTATVHLAGNFVTLLHFTVWAGTSGPTTLTQVGRAPDALHNLEPRDMFLVLQRSARGGYDCIPKAGGVQSPTVYLPITPVQLAGDVDHVQQALLEVVNVRDATGRKAFQTGVQIDPQLEQVALTTLAKAGGRLFRNLFFHPAAGQDAKDLGNYLRTEASDEDNLLTLQVVDQEAAIPWALLYVGDLSDGAQLDWQQFLGLRHVIEQVPLGPLIPGRTTTIASRPELSVGLNVNLLVGKEKLNAKVADHQRRWQDLTTRRERLRLTPRSTRSTVLDALKDPANSEQILYFYCHATAQGPEGDVGQAAITMEPGQPLTLDDLTNNAGVDVPLPSHPVVFINACESADLTPLFYSGFVPYFLSRGARGVIGTQCDTPALFAIRFAETFFDRILDGQPVGESMLATRRDFLDRFRNPLGLLYAVHCDIDTRVDPAVLAPSS